MSDTLRTYTTRPKRYEDVDGTADIFFGLMLLGGALASGLEAFLPADSPRWVHGVVGYGVLIPALGLGFWLRKFIKRRWTWQRTGYVAYRREARWWAGIAASIVIAVVLAAGAAWLLRSGGRHTGMSLSQAGLWVVFPAVYAFWIILTSREHPWKWLLLVFVLLGFLVIGLLVHGDYARVDWQVMSFFGLAWLGSGGGTLYSYIRHTEPPASEAE